MSETYLDRWQTAQFRGIEFPTDSHDAAGGRRLAVHEFPGADAPLVEDLGGKAQTWTINAYFLGAQYDANCNALTEALFKPGADWLIHPWLGRIYVAARQWSRRESSGENGFCTLSIEFVAGGEAPATPVADDLDIARFAAAFFAHQSAADFNLLKMASDGVNAFAATVQGKLDYIRQAVSLATLPLTWRSQLVGLVGSLHTELGELVAMPSRYATALRGLTDALGLGGEAAGLPATERPKLVTRLATLAVANAGAATVSGTAITAANVQTNLAAEARLRSYLFLAAATQAAITEYRTATDRDAALAAVSAAYSQLMPAMPDDLFQAAASARAALLHAVAAQDLQPQTRREVVQPLPAAVLAHRLQIDDATFAALNAVRHPLFVQGVVYG